MLNQREIEFERVCAVEMANEYSEGGLFDKIMEQYMIGVITGIELIMEKIKPSFSVTYYKMSYDEYCSRCWFFFDETFNVNMEMGRMGVPQ